MIFLFSILLVYSFKLTMTYLIILEIIGDDIYELNLENAMIIIKLKKKYDETNFITYLGTISILFYSQF